MNQNSKTIDLGMAKLMQMANDRILAGLKILGQDAIEYTVLNGVKGYKNRTFNLHDSHGYGIYMDGSLVYHKLLDPLAVKPDTKQGFGKDMAEAFLNSYKPSGNGWVLVVVAGEFYADAVQNQYNLDVLTGAYQYTSENFELTFKLMR